MSLDAQNSLSSVPEIILDDVPIPHATGGQITHSSPENVASKVFSRVLTFVSQAVSVARDLSNVGSVVASEVSALVNTVGSHDALLTQLGLKSTPNKEAYLQVLAQLAVYDTYPKGHLFAPSDLFTSPQYQLKKTIEYPEGVKIMVLTTENEQESPLMLIRGTDPSNIDNVMDTLSINMGKLNAKQYKNELACELEELAIAHGRIHIIGHSYGGALAQQLTSKHPDLICRCSFYNAPGVGEKVVKEYQNNIAILPAEYPRPEIVSYRHAKDLPSLLGGESLPTDPGRNYTAGSVYDAISHVDVHSLNTLSSGIFHTNSDHSHRHYNKISSFIEHSRGQLGKIVPLYKKLKEGIKGL